LPLIYAMQHGTAEQAAVVREAIENGNVEQFGAVLEIIHATGALEHTRQIALRETEAACAALAGLPDTQHKQCLLDLAHFAASREF
jgi:octaprenyl-diphosphate synthase